MHTKKVDTVGQSTARLMLRSVFQGHNQNLNMDTRRHIMGSVLSQLIIWDRDHLIQNSPIITGMVQGMGRGMGLGIGRGMGRGMGQGMGQGMWQTWK